MVESYESGKTSFEIAAELGNSDSFKAQFPDSQLPTDFADQLAGRLLNDQADVSLNQYFRNWILKTLNAGASRTYIITMAAHKVEPKDARSSTETIQPKEQTVYAIQLPTTGTAATELNSIVSGFDDTVSKMPDANGGTDTTVGTGGTGVDPDRIATDPDQNPGNPSYNGKPASSSGYTPPM